MRTMARGDLTGQVERLSLREVQISFSRAWVPASPGCLRWVCGARETVSNRSSMPPAGERRGGGEEVERRRESQEDFLEEVPPKMIQNGLPC